MTVYILDCQEEKCWIFSWSVGPLEDKDPEEEEDSSAEKLGLGRDYT